MANQIPIRPWSRLGSLHSPQSHLPPQPAEPSLKSTKTSSNDNNANATKSVPTAPPDVDSPIQPQKLKLTTPITFPPSKMKVQPQIETKIAVEEEVTIEKTNGNGNGNGSGSEGHGIRVITISGENRGAYMQITKSQKKPVHNSEKVRALSSPPMKAMCVNSNVQCVNNSMLFNTSCIRHDPGVHLILPKKVI